MKLKDHLQIRTMAKELNLGRFTNAEIAIREFCFQRIEEIIKDFGEIDNIETLLKIVSSNLKLKFEELYNNNDLQRISQKYIDKGEIIFRDLPNQIDDNTDAILVSLRNFKPWEHKYVAIIDCRGYKLHRAFFSKWHEVGHVLTLPPQMSFKFRQTLSKKKEPEEQIVDRIAGDLAFYTPLFLPELLARIKNKERLTFDIIQDLRETICPGASMEATIRGSISRTPFPQLFVIAYYGFKKAEQRIVNSNQLDLFPENENQFEPKLRAIEVIRNDTAYKAGLMIYTNMEVPQESVITTAYKKRGLGNITYSNFENLSWWKHSRGPLSNMNIYVEAIGIRNKVFSLISQVK